MESCEMDFITSNFTIDLTSEGRFVLIKSMYFVFILIVRYFQLLRWSK